VSEVRTVLICDFCSGHPEKVANRAYLVRCAPDSHRQADIAYNRRSVPTAIIAVACPCRNEPPDFRWLHAAVRCSKEITAASLDHAFWFRWQSQGYTPPVYRASTLMLICRVSARETAAYLTRTAACLLRCCSAEIAGSFCSYLRTRQLPRCYAAKITGLRQPAILRVKQLS
jgi:hypothetical protein